jgi:branched-chain amino acid transport system permease protein
MSSQWIADGIVLGCSYGLFAASMGLIRQVARFFDFSLAAVYTIAAYAAYALRRQALSLPIAITAGVLLAITLGLTAHTTVFRPLQRRRATAEVLLLASLGLTIALDNAVSLIWGDATLAFPRLSSNDGLLIAGAHLTWPQIRIVVIDGTVGLALWSVIRFTRFGMLLRAVSSDVELSRVRGIRVDRIISATVAIASAIAAIVAMNNALDTDLVPLMGFNLILLAAVSLIVGGIGSVGGAFCGGLLIAMTQQFSASLLPIQWQETIVFGLLIGFIFVRPTGILGRPLPKTTV